MQLDTPPQNQGQIVEVSYGWHEGTLYRRVYDHSDRSEAWSRADADAARELASTDWEPWNADCPLERDDWVACADPTAR